MISACVLAGGLSSRMGRDKARLRLEGRTLLARVRAIVKEAGLSARVIRQDLVQRCGPLGGVLTALRTTSAEAVLFLSCDMPFVSARLIATVLAHLKPETMAVFTEDQRCLGFPFLLRKEALETVEELLAEDEFSLQTLGRRLKAVRVKVPASHVAELRNINTPADFAAAQEALARSAKRRPQGSR